jgi:hypothetical protein
MTTQKIYAIPETAITFKDSGGTVNIALQNLAHQVGEWSELWDRGAGAKPMRYRLNALLPYQSTGGAAGEQTEVYIATSVDGTNFDGGVTADAAFAAQHRVNCEFVGVTVLAAASVADALLMFTRTVEIYNRYVLIGVWNNTAAEHLQDDANACVITLTPVPDEIQAAA